MTAKSETLSQASKWDFNNRRWLAAGFCVRCAAQAAWGQQLGFSQVAAPCVKCVGKSAPDGTGIRARSWARSRVQNIP